MSELNPTPLAIVQDQLDAYNAKDIDALLGTYAIDAEIFTLHGPLLAKGHKELRERFLIRFSEPDLNAKLVSRMSVGNLVIDLELVTRNFPDGKGTVEMMCIYQVSNGRIERASFAVF